MHIGIRSSLSLPDLDFRPSIRYSALQAVVR